MSKSRPEEEKEVRQPRSHPQLASWRIVWQTHIRDVASFASSSNRDARRPSSRPPPLRFGSLGCNAVVCLTIIPSPQDVLLSSHPHPSHDILTSYRPPTAHAVRLDAIRRRLYTPAQACWLPIISRRNMAVDLPPLDAIHMIRYGYLGAACGVSGHGKVYGCAG